MAELLAIVAEIKERAPGAGIIMIEGELAAQSLYASRANISDALIYLDPLGARIRWNEITPRVTYKVPGNKFGPFTITRTRHVEIQNMPLK